MATGSQRAQRSAQQLFAPMPLRAMAAGLSGLQMSVLLCVASHDRRSLVTGKGQGCRASNDRMSSMVGCSYARLCSTLSELAADGDEALPGGPYLQRERLGRHTVYRVIYTDEEGLPFGNVSSGSTGSPAARVICCQHGPKTGEISPKLASQYISLNEGRDSEESGEYNSEESARENARQLGKTEFADNAGGQMARFERRLNAGRIASVDVLEKWLVWLGRVQSDFDPGTPEFEQAQRLWCEVDAFLSPPA